MTDSMVNRAKDDLATAIYDSVFEALCTGTLQHVARRYHVEDAELSGLDPDVWPLVLIDLNGDRFEVDIDVHVIEMPPVGLGGSDA